MMGVDFLMPDLKRNISEFVDLIEPEPDRYEYYTDGQNLYSFEMEALDLHVPGSRPRLQASTVTSTSPEDHFSVDSLYGSDNGADADEFSVSFDCHQYTPDQIDVKYTDGDVVVTASLAREHQVIVRRCPLPRDVDPRTISSTFKSNGILLIRADKWRASDIHIPVHVPYSQPDTVDAEDGYMSA